MAVGPVVRKDKYANNAVTAQLNAITGPNLTATLFQPAEIKLRELNVDSEALHADNDMHSLLQDVVIEVPYARCDDVQHGGPEDDADEHGQWRL